MSQPPYSGPPYGEQPPSGQPQPGQPPYQGQPYPGQPYSGQPYSGQPYPGQPYPGQPYPEQPPATQPYPGQPYPGQPNPDVPTSVPPGFPPTQAYPSGSDYGQPQYPDQAQYGAGQYGQPQYGQPQYGDQGYAAPGFPPVPPKKKSKALPIVLVSVAVVLVLCVGGGVAIFLAAKNKVDKTRDSLNTSSSAIPTGEPTTTAPSGSPGGTKAAISVVEPKTLGGRPKLDSKELKPTVELLKSLMANGPTVTKSVGAAYGKISTRDVVIMTAAQGEIDDPEGLVDDLLAARGSSTKVTGIVQVPTGKLGGTAKCGGATSAGERLAFCAWADEGSVGAMFFYFKSTSTAKAQFPAARAEIEQKS